MGVRRKSRESTLEVLYELEIKDSTNREIQEALLNYWQTKQEDEKNISEEVKEFTNSLVTGIFSHKDELDRYIKKHAKNWDFERIAKIDKNIMRIALFEMLFVPEIPVIVSINEAVEIAKRYSSAEADKFINGILDSIRKEIENKSK